MSLLIRCLFSTLVLVAPQFANAADSSMLRVLCDGDDLGAEVSVNGKFKGECPIDMQVGAGTLKLRVYKAVDVEKDRLYEQEIRIGEGVVKKVEAVLTPRLTAEGKIREAERARQEAERARQEEARVAEEKRKAGEGWAESDNGADINWNEATQYCASKGSGWRLPTVAELQASYQSGHSTPCGQRTCKVSSNSRLTSYYFWTNERNGSSEAWFVLLSFGPRYATHVEHRSSARALCVRRP